MARRRAGTVRKLPSGRWQARCWNPAGERISAPATFATKGDAQRWLTLKEPHLAASTTDLYCYLLRRHVAPRLGSTAVGRITAVDVQAWLADLHASDLSPNTVAKAYRLLKGSLDGAVEAGLIARTPCTLKGAGGRDRIPPGRGRRRGRPRPVRLGARRGRPGRRRRRGARGDRARRRR